MSEDLDLHALKVILFVNPIAKGECVPNAALINLDNVGSLTEYNFCTKPVGSFLLGIMFASKLLGAWLSMIFVPKLLGVWLNITFAPKMLGVWLSIIFVRISF